MNLFGVMDVSASALTAERIRAEVTASNMANAETTRTSAGTPYKRQHVVFQAAAMEPGLNGMQPPAFPGTASFASMLGEHVAGQVTAPGGVEVSAVVEDQSPALKRFDPQHPDADKNGYVSFPNIDPLTEMVDLLGATRAYGLNSSAVQAAKGMITASLDLLK
ncbi:MAG: flagellar basal body rod protein FlgC [Acidobacteriaceae bacterium]